MMSVEFCNFNTLHQVVESILNAEYVVPINELQDRVKEELKECSIYVNLRSIYPFIPTLPLSVNSADALNIRRYIHIVPSNSISKWINADDLLVTGNAVAMKDMLEYIARCYFTYSLNESDRTLRGFIRAATSKNQYNSVFPYLKEEAKLYLTLKALRCNPKYSINTEGNRELLDCEIVEKFD